MIMGEKPESASIEKASVSAMKAIWGQPAGLTILVFDLFLLASFMLNFRRKPKSKRPELSFLIYDISVLILLCTVTIFCIIKLQTYLAQSAVIPASFAHNDTSSIDLIFITFIVVSGLSTIIYGMINKKKK
jgi:hypothetical protein